MVLHTKQLKKNLKLKILFYTTTFVLVHMF